MPSLEDLVRLVPEDLLGRSGGLLYSGRSAWIGQKEVYLLGLNPGGSEAEGVTDQGGDQPHSIRQQIADVLDRREDRWSAFVSESWKGRPPGEEPMQRRVRHLLGELQLAPADVPASNVVFTRTRSEADLEGQTANIAAACWPFHQAVIDGLQVRVIVCFGGTAGDLVRKAVGADEEPYDRFQETNQRKWTSEAYRAPHGRSVVVLPHPSRADWCSKDADPSPMVQRVLGAARG